jgi:hypothetical protein
MFTVLYKKYRLDVRNGTRIGGHPFRTFMIRFGIALAAVSGLYAIGGMAGLVPLSTDSLAWNNIRIVSGLTIVGCMMAAIGYGNE